MLYVCGTEEEERRRGGGLRLWSVIRGLTCAEGGRVRAPMASCENGYGKKTEGASPLARAVHASCSGIDTDRYYSWEKEMSQYPAVPRDFQSK